MGVLEQMRSGSDSTFMQVVLAMVVVAFVFMYASPQGDIAGVRATVNGVRILDTDYGRAYRDQLRTVEQQQGRTLSDEDQKQLGEQVRQRLIEQEVLLQEAHRIGLEVSDTEIARMLVGLPFLIDDDGNFSTDMYDRFLKRQQYKKDDFEVRLRKELLRGKLRQLAYMGASVSEPALREAFIEQETRVDITMVRIRPSAFEDDVVITDAERDDWLAENENLVKETYDRDLSRLYNHPEQIRYRMIRLGVQKDGPSLADLVPILNGVREEIVAGADFAEQAQRWSEDPTAMEGGDKGLRAVSQLSLEMQEATEGLVAGQLTKVFPAGSDVRLVRVEERVEPRIDTLDDVRVDIAEALMRAERLPALAAGFAEDELLAQWTTTGTPPQELLDGRGLAARPTGSIPTQRGSNLFAPPQEVLDAARTAEVGAVLPEVFEDGGSLYVAQLNDRTEPDMERFEEDKDKLREVVLSQRRVAFFEGWVQMLKSQATIE